MANTLFSRVIQRLANRLIEPVNKFVYRHFHEFPFGNSPRASTETYTKIWIEARKKQYSIIDDYENELGYSINEDWFHKLALLTQVVIKESDICYQHGRLLYTTLSHYIDKKPCKSLNILETGTARGFSALCMAKGLHDKNQSGKILTFDVLPHDVKMYWNCIADEQGSQTRSELLKNYDSLIENFIIFHQGDTKLELKKVHIPRVHFAFLDGMHTYEYLLREFDYLKDKQQNGDIIIFDDYNPSQFPGIVKAVDEICTEHGYSKRVITLSSKRGYVIGQKMKA